MVSEKPHVPEDYEWPEWYTNCRGLEAALAAVRNDLPAWAETARRLNGGKE